YLDRVQLTGKLTTPQNTPDFNYQAYLMKDGIYSVMDFPAIKFISPAQHITFFEFLYQKIVALKEKLRTSITATFNPPHTFILEGILLGNNKTMPQDLRTKLDGTGLRYLTAISGLHIILISDIVVSFLLFLGLWRQQATAGSLAFIWVYVVLTGCTASGV